MPGDGADRRASEFDRGRPARATRRTGGGQQRCFIGRGSDGASHRRGLERAEISGGNLISAGGGTPNARHASPVRLSERKGVPSGSTSSPPPPPPARRSLCQSACALAVRLSRRRRGPFTSPSCTRLPHSASPSVRLPSQACQPFASSPSLALSLSPQQPPWLLSYSLAFSLARKKGCSLCTAHSDLHDFSASVLSLPAAVRPPEAISREPVVHCQESRSQLNDGDIDGRKRTPSGDVGIP